jgi:hypothetical protein
MLEPWGPLLCDLRAVAHRRWRAAPRLEDQHPGASAMKAIFLPLAAIAAALWAHGGAHGAVAETAAGILMPVAAVVAALWAHGAVAQATSDMRPPPRSCHSPASSPQRGSSSIHRWRTRWPRGGSSSRTGPRTCGSCRSPAQRPSRFHRALGTSTLPWTTGPTAGKTPAATLSSSVAYPRARTGSRSSSPMPIIRPSTRASSSSRSRGPPPWGLHKVVGSPAPFAATSLAGRRVFSVKRSPGSLSDLAPWGSLIELRRVSIASPGSVPQEQLPANRPADRDPSAAVG